MPALDPCADGCPTSITTNRIPGATDDSCNNSDLGFFCVGSWFIYDPTLPGADTATDGDCPRAFLRIGGNCNVDEWLEINVASRIESVSDPVDGSDCCPAGTIWNNTASGENFISLGNCTWCLLCSAQYTSLVTHAVSAGITWDGIAVIPPVGLLQGLVPATATLTNTTTRNMTVQIVWQGYGADFSFQSANPLLLSYAIQPHYYLDGAIQGNPFAQDALATLIGDVTVLEIDGPTDSWTTTAILAPGATITASMDASLLTSFEHNATINARISIDPGTVSMQAVTQ